MHCYRNGFNSFIYSRVVRYEVTFYIINVIKKSIFILLGEEEQNNHMTQPNNNGVGVGWRDMFYLTTHSTHFIYDYMASDIW